ncbi:glycosyltransferase [uncultured Tenacibaculum sp.]|uniref:glycosyltransferase n=1 Tax=uncultured Tenacibaculum sp. TaxID=174713 RepID=UPI00263397CE|nr:glycosyltransferase [uncultured Tenacibaculum sp.]
MNKKKKKVLLAGIDGLTHYRVEMFDMLCENYELTIAHTNDALPNTKFSQVKVYPNKKGPFFTVKDLPKLSEYDVVIFSFNIRILNIYLELFKKRNYKLLFFGIGVSASYHNQYDENKKLDKLRRYLIKKSDGAIFYEHYPLIKYQSLKIDPNKLHVAYNTVVSPKSFKFSNKTFESFMFIGTLYKQKKIYDLLHAYELLYSKLKDRTPRLEIVGDGDEYNNINSWIHEKGLNGKIILHGKITNEEDLLPIFERALVCVSPGQAGLSVQKSFSYGTPFITTKKAITGGELFCIINQVNGFIYNGKVEDLSKLMGNIAERIYDIESISKNALMFYSNFRTPDIWKNAFVEAIG